MPTTLLCAMKTRTDGYFYIPTLGPFFGGETGPPKSLKIELLFDDPRIEGDQTGGTPPPEYSEAGLTRWPDGTVDIYDQNVVSATYGKSEGDSDWDYMADINADKTCDIYDLTIINNNYGNTGTYSSDLSDVTVEFDTGDICTPNEDGFLNIPEGATYFYVKKSGTAIGALITFWKEPVVTYSLSINVDKEIGYVGDVFTFYGVLTQNGTPIPGATVTLYKDGVSTGLTDTTKSDGTYSINWQADEVGSYSFYAEATF